MGWSVKAVVDECVGLFAQLTAREQLHITALQYFVHRDFNSAMEVYASIALRFPADVSVVQQLILLNFFGGGSGQGEKELLRVKYSTLPVKFST